MIKALIFDVDGTLINSVDAHARAWCDAFQEFGYEIKFLRMRHQIGKGGDQLMPVFLSEKEIKTIGKALEKRRKEIFQENYLPHVKAFPQVRELFEKVLASHKRVALASSAAGEELEVYKKITNITDLIDEETSKDDAKKSKPYPDIFQAALKKLKGPSQDEVLIIGDTPYDAEAAGKAGIACIGVLAGGFPAEELKAAGCHAIYRDPSDLLLNYDKWIEGN